SAALLGAAAASVREVFAQDSPPSTPSAATFPEVPASMKVPGAPVGVHLYGEPSVFEANVVRKILPAQKQYLSSTSRTPLQDLDGIITPNGLFYERHHAGIP